MIFTLPIDLLSLSQLRQRQEVTAIFPETSSLCAKLKGDVIRFEREGCSQDAVITNVHRWTGYGDIETPLERRIWPALSLNQFYDVVLNARDPQKGNYPLIAFELKAASAAPSFY